MKEGYEPKNTLQNGGKIEVVRDNDENAIKIRDVREESEISLYIASEDLKNLFEVERASIEGATGHFLLLVEKLLKNRDPLAAQDVGIGTALNDIVDAMWDTYDDITSVLDEDTPRRTND